MFKYHYQLVTIMKYLTYIGQGIKEAAHRVLDVFERFEDRAFMRQYRNSYVRIESSNGDQSYRPVRDDEIGTGRSLDTHL
jgi:hypothetical protein